MLDNLEKITFLGVPLHVSSLYETREVIRKSVYEGKVIQHVVVNVAKLVNLRSDEQLRNSVLSCDIINIDGMGVVLGARLLGYKVSERVAGIDLFLSLIEMAAEERFPVFLLGAKEDVVSDVVHKLGQRHPDLIVAGYHHGYFWDDEVEVVEKIKKSGAKLLFVAITSPKKENFINRWKDSLGVNFVMGVGGAFDVVAGRVNRAPLWMQRFALEWLYRIYQEPRRMWKRYFLTNSIYMFLLLKEYFSNKKL